jgi:hypothetical protein
MKYVLQLSAALGQAATKKEGRREGGREGGRREDET